MKIILTVFLISILSTPLFSQSEMPLKLGVVGMSHSHLHGLLSREDRGDIDIVGFVEIDKALAKRFSGWYNFSMNIVYNTIEELIAAKQPEAVAAFGSIYSHLEVVEKSAPKGIHIMVEKPLAVSMKHAIKMKKLAKKHKVQLLTNYETTWYPTNHKAYEITHNNSIGDLRKIVVHDGHRGPAEIGVNQEFLDWLTDPVLNGGGALIDFGCYGANLVTWLNKGEKPDAVMAVTHTNKPDIYPNVDDEATIVLQYPKMQAIIQASWNWPIDRKDMEVYGVSGYVISENRSDIRYRLTGSETEKNEILKPRIAPLDDPFAMFAAVIKGKISLPANDLSSLENNMTVVEILDAARKSAKTGRLIKLKK